MLLAHAGWRSSVLLVASVFVGLAQETVADCKSSEDDQWLARDIPSCAEPCVKHFIQAEFNTGSCCDGTSRSCLCRTNSTIGLTLGEAALACTYGSCSADIISNVTTAVYTICNDVNGALPETHATITATRVPETVSASNPTATSSPSTATWPSTTEPPLTTQGTSPTTVVTSTLVSNTQIIPPVTTFSTSAIPGPTTYPATTSTAPSSASATAQPASSSLGSSAVIGISVASGVSAIFLVSVAVILCGKRLRRRRLEAQASEGFEIGGDMSEPPDFYSRRSPNPLHPFPTVGGGVAPENPGPNFHQFPTQPIARNGPLQIVTSTQGNEIGGPGFTPKTDYDGSPQSQTSQHTLSQLLPGYPTTQGLFPDPLNFMHRGPQLQPRLRPTSDATMIDEEDARRISVSGKPFDHAQSHARQVSDSEQNQQRPIGLPANPRSTIRPIGRRGKEHTLQMGGKVYRWETPDDVGLPPTPPPKSDGSIQVGRAVTRYSTSFQGPRSSSVKSGTGNMNLQRNFSRLGNGLRSMSRISRTLEEPNTASKERERDQPVENNDPEGSHDNEYRRLGRSPVKYPTMPRPAAVAPVAEALPTPRAAHLYERPQSKGSRSSPIKGLFNIPLIIDDSSRSRSNSPGGLLAKRRGEKMAERMESQFRVGVQNTQGLPKQQTRGRPRWKVVQKQSPGPVSVVGSITPKTPQESAKTPQKHNITPTRRGDDLYLSVD